MRGNPIREWIVFSVIWLTLLIPVVKLTVTHGHVHTDSGERSSHKEINRTEATIILRYTGTPTFIRISRHGEILCKIESPPAEETEQKIAIEIEDERSELLVQAHWPDKKRHAFEVELIVDGKEERSNRFWTEGELDEIAVFRWHP